MKVLTNTAVLVEKEEEKESKNVVELKLVSSDGNPPSSGNWLMDLPIGQVFLIQDKQKPRDFMLGLFRLIGKEGKAVVLMTTASQDPIYVNPSRFCSQYDCYEKVAVVVTESLPKEQEEVLEEANDERDRVQ